MGVECRGVTQTPSDASSGMAKEHLWTRWAHSPWLGYYPPHKYDPAIEAWVIMKLVSNFQVARLWSGFKSGVVWVGQPITLSLPTQV